MTGILNSPRLGLWLSIIAGVVLVIGLSYAIATQTANSDPSGAPTDDVVSALAGTDQ